jgi:hypothetical protein
LYAYAINDPVNLVDPSGLKGGFIDFIRDQVVEKVRDTIKAQDRLTPAEEDRKILQDYSRRSQEIEKYIPCGPSKVKSLKDLKREYVFKLTLAKLGYKSGQLGGLLDSLGDLLQFFNPLDPKGATGIVVTEGAKEGTKAAGGARDALQTSTNDALTKALGPSAVRPR